MKTTEWSHLPNAAHIDRVVASVKAHTEEWVAAWSEAWGAALTAAYDAKRSARVAVLNAARDAVLNAVLNAARDARDAAYDAAYDVAYDVAYDAILALIAWDDCSQYLDMPSEQLEMWYHLSEQPACLLLLPAVRAFEQINELELVA